ncbi:undecaprenyl/decaprenyl-phosphate alpha-N-acetylglucosaminyl 1-phosphate transferase [Candidatus Peribacteria bacterium]|nr:MAG: undecaprenyl/decaprenyl-phosphate alpha-N-acetylglucosaminyl 1-phosphate transferase [Candidatus Peribacteria bacterium]
MTPLLTSPLLAGLLCVCLHLLALRMFPRMGLLDFPERYGLIRARLPYPTGILGVLTFLIVYALMNYGVWTMQHAGLVIGVLLLGISCFTDDRRQLSPGTRLLFQVLIALLIFATGTRIYTLTNPLGDSFLKLDTWIVGVPYFGTLPIWSGVFTVVWLMLTINALNWFDGIPGQVSILSVIGFLTIGLLSLSSRVNQPELALLAFILAGIAIACFLFDVPPPRVVLGDSGSMFFGLMLGTLTIFAGGKVATAFLVLGVPLIDSFFVIMRRILQGKSPMKGSQSGEHLHHRLLAKGWSPRQVIALTASIGLLFGSTALFLSSFQKLIAALCLFLLMLGLSWYSAPKSIDRP